MLKHYLKSAFLLLPFVLISACKQPSTLPILGPFERVNGEKEFHPVADFKLIDQYGDAFSAEAVKNKIRIVDFFFTSCPTICPKVQAQMLRIQEHFSDADELLLLSHSIDPKRDTVAKLRHYAQNLGVEAGDNWYFLTGSKEEIYGLADDYFNIVVEDASAPGGFDHTGRIVVVDPQGYIRAYANGVDPKAADELFPLIQALLNK